jgi:hypothetical protein
MTRTFSQADWQSALSQWNDGDFSDEWRPWRHRAAMRGMIYPPEGSKWDSWEDDQPSQRAMLIRAIRDTPRLLETAIDRSRSWGEVIRYVLAQRDEWREELNARARQVAFDKRSEQRAEHRGAVMSIAQIVERIRESR